MDYNRIELNASARQPASGRVLIIYTGGTLGMSYDEGGVLVPFDFKHILEEVPSLSTLDLALTVIAFPEPIDSSDIRLPHWQMIGRILVEHYEEFDGFVVLHGTDTMAYTASAMSFMLQGITKPVIFTGAQLPISSRRTDGRENLVAALEIASTQQEGKAVVQEVCIYFGDTLLRGNRTKKLQSDLFDAFESRNYPVLAHAGITIDYNHEFLFRPSLGQPDYFEDLNENVTVLTLHPAITETETRAVLEQEHLSGLVMLTYGTGNAPTYDWFLNLLKETVDRGVRIMNVTQCNGGQVMQGKYRSSRALLDMGIIGGDGITMEAALTKMMYVLGREKTRERIDTLLASSICGEMT